MNNAVFGTQIVVIVPMVSYYIFLNSYGFAKL